MGKYDRNFKVLGEDDPRGLLFLFAGLPLDEGVEVEPLDKELALPGLLVDNAFLVTEGDRRFILHLECELRWNKRHPVDTRRYLQALVLKYDLPVYSYLVVLIPPIPGDVPVEHREERGDFSMRWRYRLVRFWELDAAPALEANRRGLLPWVPLMRASPQQMKQAGRRVADDSELSAQFLALGQLNPQYDEERLLKLMGRNPMTILKDEIIEQSPFIQYYQQKAMKAGREEGREEGRDDGERQATLKLLESIVADRFGQLRIPASLKREPVDKVQTIVRQIVLAGNRKEAEAILRKRR